MTTNDFIQRAKSVHGNKYDYSVSNYINAKQKIEILCPTHGKFSQYAGNHFKGCGCPKCGVVSKSTPNMDTDEFIQQASVKHSNKYNYSKVVYTGYNNKITIICPTHGEFTQRANNHLAGIGCKKCGTEKTRTKLLKTYNVPAFSKLIRTDSSPLTVNLREYFCSCGKTIITSGYMVSVGRSMSCGCRLPGRAPGSPVKEVEEYVDSLGVSFSVDDRSVISPYELDIWIPDYNLAIEFNGGYYHSLTGQESFDAKFRHRDKFYRCKNQGILLLQIDEHEWKNPITREVWKSVIGSKLKKHTRVFARNTVFSVITKQEAAEFLSENHLQGGNMVANEDWCYGLYYEKVLSGVMTFSRHEKTMINLTRMAFSRGITIVGGAQKLFLNAVKYLPDLPIVTFSNNRYSGGEVYEKLGFLKDKKLPPSYQWVFKGKVGNKRLFRRKSLEKILGDKFDPSKTERQNLYLAGARCLYDAGYERWIYLGKSISSRNNNKLVKLLDSVGETESEFTI